MDKQYFWELHNNTTGNAGGATNLYGGSVTATSGSFSGTVTANGNIGVNFTASVDFHP